ncbi:MAG: DUF5668 domain-containing protein [Bellilinea sp.]
MNDRRYRSLFWPILLIGVGVIWLLGNLGIIPAANFAVLASLWPVILIIIGLDVLFARSSPLIGALIGLLAIGGVIVVLIAGPALGLPNASVLRHEAIREPLGEAVRAELTLNLSSQPARIYALNQSNSNLLEGEIDFFGDLRFSSSGSALRKIHLERFNAAPSVMFSVDPTARWEIGLTPTIPLDLNINSASGSVELNFSALQLSALYLDQGSGSLNLTLPSTLDPYIATVKGGSGSLRIQLPQQGPLTLRLDGGSGSININSLRQSAIRLEIRDGGSGSVNVPNWMQRISGQDKEGVWESADYQTAANSILIICDDLGSGSFNLR